MAEKNYTPFISITSNQKAAGCFIDLDTTKGCSHGMANNSRGCYGLCYAAKMSRMRGIDFACTVVRHFKSPAHRDKIIRTIAASSALFVRIGVSGDPSDCWEHTATVTGQIKLAGSPSC